ncbi:MAG TPA: alpha/beta hydrolase [Opitutaceae bacterium]|jgi:pimeloyl-ACP methyl ester carboxylesterase
MKKLSAAILFSLLAAGAWAADIPYGSNPAAGAYHEIRGFRMYCEEYGSGPAVLMIHGNGGDMTAFRKTAPYFSAKYHVILADSRSQGRSADPSHGINFEMMADDFAALLDVLHVKAAYVIGFSDGGINALELAMRHPDKVLAVASTGANLWPGEDAFADGLWAGMDADYKRQLGMPRTTEKEKNDWKMSVLDHNEPHISLADLHKISCPVLVICGDHDMISVTHTVLIYKNIPRANLWVVPNSGHATLLEHPGDFNREVDAFFRTPFKVR